VCTREKVTQGLTLIQTEVYQAGTVGWITQRIIVLSVELVTQELAEYIGKTRSARILQWNKQPEGMT